jgi:hypothetical protein
MTSFAGLATRLIAAGCCAALVAACSSGSSTPPGGTKPGGSSPSATTPGAGSTPAAQGGSGTGACATSALKAAVSGGGDAAAGNDYYPLDLTNTSAASCTLDGYPGVSWVASAGGSQVGAAASRAPSGFRPYGSAPAAITLAPSQTVFAVLNVQNPGFFSASACGSTVSTSTLRVYPPNQTAPLYVSFSGQTCSGSQVTLTVGPVQPAGSPTP